MANFRSPKVALLCGRCRWADRASVDSGIPIRFFDAGFLARFLSSRQSVPVDDSVETHRALLARQTAERWDEISRAKAARQATLGGTGSTLFD